MGVFLQVKKQMFTMLKVQKIKNMQLKFIKLVFQFLKIEKNMLLENLGLEEVIASQIQEN